MAAPLRRAAPAASSVGVVTDASADSPTPQHDSVRDAPGTSPTPDVDLDEIERDLEAVERALDHLSEGTYWTDEVTGQPIPDDTWFVPALHDTTTDEVTIFNRGRKSGLFGDDVEEIIGALVLVNTREEAGFTQRDHRLVITHTEATRNIGLQIKIADNDRLGDIQGIEGNDKQLGIDKAIATASGCADKNPIGSIPEVAG